MRILVTGGAGFIGSHIVDRLLTGGHTVSVVDDLSSGCAEHLPPGVKLKRHSILVPGWERACDGAQVMVHAAAQTAVSRAVSDPELDAAVNVIGTIRAVQAAAAAGVRRVIYLSSAAVYGNAENPPLPEETPLLPASPYGLSKLTGEYYTRLLADAAGMEWVILRLANVYGPRQRADGEAGVIARWAAAHGQSQPITLYGDGSQTRDFLFVKDVAEAAARAAEGGGVAGETMNLGTGKGTSLAALLHTLERISGRAAAVNRLGVRPGDIAHSALDVRRAERLLGWRAAIPLEAGLSETLAEALKRL